MIDRVFDGLVHWYRVCGGASDGARTIEHDGVAAAVVPAAPERAIVNGAVCHAPGALEPVYDEIADAYGAIGATWTVWVRPDDAGSARFLEERGHVLDAQPMAMARELDDVERPPEGALEDWTGEGDVLAVGPLNDRAYGFGSDSFTRALTRLPGGATRVYLARRDGEPVACLLTTDGDEGNTDVEAVAVPPEARGQGSSGRLLAHALADAAERGRTTSTLVATRLGYPVYERLGYRPLEPVSMWERRPGA